MLESEVGGEALREVGVESVGDQDGDLRGRGEFAEPGQDRSGAGRLVVRRLRERAVLWPLQMGGIRRPLCARPTAP